MIFKPELVEKVLDGSKTMTRRPLKTSVECDCRYRPGRDYAVQEKRGGKALGRIRILKVERQPLGWCDDEDAVLEGFTGRADFMRYWTRLYGSTKLDQPVWAITFERIEDV